MGLEPGQTIGSYQIESEVGSGGMAVVYKAKHLYLHSDHAIKVLNEGLARSEEVRQRFLSEGRIQAGLRHPHITAVTDLIAESGIAALVMPFLCGEDLAQRLARQGAASVKEAVDWTLQTLEALAFVHARGVIHRDLKPANLFLESRDDGRLEIRVMDFGIARLAGSTLTRTAMTMGTPHYMSPEQIQSPKSVDARSDLFSLGAVLYELLTGQVAFNGDTDFLIQMRIVSGEYKRPSTLLPQRHAPLSAVVERALSSKAEDRFSDAQAFAQALKEALQTIDSPSALGSSPKPSQTMDEPAAREPEDNAGSATATRDDVDEAAASTSCTHTGDAISIDITGEGARVTIWGEDGPLDLTEQMGGPYPLAVGLDKRGHLRTGHGALRQAVTRPQETVTHLTALLGLNAASLKKHLGGVGLVVKGEQVCLGAGRYTVPELIELSLRGLRHHLSARRIWEAEPGRDCTVLVIPSMVRMRDRIALIQLSAFNVRRMLGAGVAAALVEGLRSQDEALVLVVHAGETSLDVALLAFDDNLVEVRGVSGVLADGQHKVTQAIERYLISKAEMQDRGVTSDPTSKARLRDTAARAAPQVLAGGAESIDLPYLTGGRAPIHLRTSVEPRHVQAAIDDVADTLMALVDRALNLWGGVKAEELDQVFLVGPLAHQRTLQIRLMQKLARPVVASATARDQAAQGGAVQASILIGKTADFLVLDALPQSLGIETLGGVMTVLLRHSNTIPLSKTEIFSTAEDNQSAVDVLVYEGEKKNVADNHLARTFRLDGIPPAPKGVPQIGVRFEIDANGMLRVSARDKATGREVAVNLT